MLVKHNINDVCSAFKPAVVELGTGGQELRIVTVLKSHDPL